MTLPGFPDAMPFEGFVGGLLIGLAAAIMLLGSGRIAGISGIFGGLLSPKPGDIAWRIAFVVGLLGAGLGMSVLDPSYVEVSPDRSLIVTGLAGVVVGVGVSMGSGCTSGHGVCGLSRFSTRSLAATLTFMGTGFLTATGIQWFLGGSL